MSPSVLILGAGAAGLAAARVLADSGVPATILEARDRVGGRIFTVNGTNVGAIELGAEFIHGRPEATWDLIRRARLIACDVPFEHMQRRNGILASVPAYSEELADTMKGLKELGKNDISFAEFLRRKKVRQMPKGARRRAIDFVSGFDAADPERVSAKSLAEEQKDLADMDQPQSRLLQGYGAMIEYMREQATSPKVVIELGAAATELRWKRGHVICTCHHTRQIHRGTHAIITLPVSTLQSPSAEGGVRFDPEIPRIRQAACKLAAGPVIKVILKFREAFWEEPAFAKAARAAPELANASFFHQPDAPIPTWWTMMPLRLPVLTGWAGGPKAHELTGRGAEALLRATITSLAALFRVRPPRLAGMLEDFHFHDWPADPFSRGAYSYVLVGGMNARAQLSKPIESTLFFAGEACDTSGQASTVAGALASGKQAAQKLLATL